MYHNKFFTTLDCNIETIYAALKDLKNYHKIIPYIKNIFFHSLDSYPIKAYIELEHLLIKLNYYCDIYFDDNNHSVKIDGYSGSFEKIEGFWSLKKISDTKTEVSYDLQFKLKSKIQHKIATKIFNLYEKKIHDKLEKYISNIIT
jgi:ribosome-associated toxin RatA of RatAB toxin-antitoxin module